MSWDRVLQNYAALPNPEKSLQNGVYLTSDDHTLTIFDGYEKAKYHFLVLPREPFKLAAGGTVPKRDLDSLTTLFKSPHTKEVLEALKVAGEKVKAMIEDEMVKDEGFKWDIQVGFHAVESMKHVHLHVISSDLISPKLKNKKHYNSFHPKAGFFLHLSDILEMVDSGSPSLPPTSNSEAILKDPLYSIYTGAEFKNIPKLKDHLESEWEKLAKKEKKKAAAEVAKRKSEESGDGGEAKRAKTGEEEQ